jgi:hypothetical protein
MTTTEKALGQATTNPNGPTQAVVTAKWPDGLLFFAPATNELIEVPQASVAPVLQEANAMQAMCLKLLKAKEAIIEAQEALEEAEDRQFTAPAALDAARKKLVAAQRDYDKAYDHIKSELGDQGYITGATNGRELMELIPLAMREQPGRGAKPWGRKFTYVRSEKVKNHWRTYQLGSKDTKQGASFVKNGQIDTKALKEQFTKIEPKLKADWGLLAGHLFPQLQSWAECMRSETAVGGDKDLLFKTEAHLFRYFVGAGVEGAWAPFEGKMAAKGSVKAEVQLARAEAALEWVYPSQTGWVWALVGPKSKQTFHIGAMRLLANIKVGGGAGASVAMELGVELDYSAALAGANGPAIKGKRAKASAQGTQVNLSQQLQSGASGSVGAEAFAGLRASGELFGGLQFQNPEKTDGREDKFDFIAAIGPKLEGQFGAGAGANLMVNYSADSGKFIMRAKAAICLGLGAKGELAIEVGVKRVVSFLEWLFRAILNAGFEFVEIIAKDAYRQATRLSVLLVEGVENAYTQLESKWDTFMKDLEDGISREDRRIKLMERILSNPGALRCATPEAHGILLWQMSRHGKLTKTAYLASNSEGFETLGRRKRAVYHICLWAQCRSQFENVVQHMTPEGKKGDFATNYQHLLNFMEIGPADSQWDDKLRNLYARLPYEPARGYALLQNNTNQFLAQAKMGNAPQYLAQLHGANLLSANMA